MNFQPGDYVLWWGEIWRVAKCHQTYCRIVRGSCVAVVFYDTLAGHQHPWRRDQIGRWVPA